MYKQTYTNRLYQNTLWHLQQHSPSFAWIESPLPKKDLVKYEEEFLTLYINDTILEKAISIHTETGIFINKKETFDISHIRNHIELFEIISSYLKPDLRVIAINISLKINPHIRNNILDGNFVEEKPTFLDSLGTNLFGSDLEKYIYEKKNKKIKVIIAHDTTCLILSGYQEIINPEAIVSCIIDHGTNFAFIYQNTILNLETGQFNDFDIPENTLIINEHSNYKDKYLFEKSVSGQYLYLHYNIEAQKLNLPTISNSLELCEIASRSNSSLESNLAKQIIRMSAELIGAQLAAMHVFHGKSLLHIIIKGYLFKKGYQYKEIIEETLQTFNVPLHKIDWINTEEDSLLGASWLVLEF